MGSRPRCVADWRACGHLKGQPTTRRGRLLGAEGLDALTHHRSSVHTGGEVSLRGGGGVKSKTCCALGAPGSRGQTAALEGSGA